MTTKMYTVQALAYNPYDPDFVRDAENKGILIETVKEDPVGLALLRLDSPSKRALQEFVRTHWGDESLVRDIKP